MTIRLQPGPSLLAWGSAAALALTGLAGCSSSDQARSPLDAPRPQTNVSTGAAGLRAVLVERADAAYQKAGSPNGDTPELHPDEKCPLGVDVRVAGRQPEEFGAGVSALGESGHRAVCEYTDPSVTFSVGHFDNASELADVVRSAGPQQEVGNAQTGSIETVGNRRFTVVRTTYPTNDTHIDYSVTITDPTQLAYAVLQVETTDEARQTYNSGQAARDLAAVLDSAG